MRAALLDQDQRFVYANVPYAEFAGKPMGEIIGRTVPEVLGEDVSAVFQPQGERALAGETVPWEGWIELPQGRRYLQRHSAPLPNEGGGIDGYFIFNRDLTDLRRGEEALVEQLAARTASEAINAAIIAAAMDCVIAIDDEGRVLEFSPAAERTFGYSRAEALGSTISELIIPPALRQRHAEGFARYLSSGQSRILGQRIEIEALRADGEIFPVELTITEVRLPQRRLFTAYVRDLTATRAAQAEIQRQREALHQSEKMAAFGSLLAGVAHELNNPLSIVIGNALMLAEAAEKTAPDLAERARRVQTAAERCGRIVRSFLAMARQRERQQSLASLRVIANSALQLLAYGLHTSGVEVTVDMPDDLPELFCDPDQIQQVLINLLVNARQALESRATPRHIGIAARVEGQMIALVVSDNGPGVPDAIRARVFDPFFTTKPAGAGTRHRLGRLSRDHRGARRRADLGACRRRRRSVHRSHPDTEGSRARHNAGDGRGHGVRVDDTRPDSRRRDRSRSIARGHAGLAGLSLRSGAHRRRGPRVIGALGLRHHFVRRADAGDGRPGAVRLVDRASAAAALARRFRHRRHVGRGRWRFPRQRGPADPGETISAGRAASAARRAEASIDGRGAGPSPQPVRLATAGAGRNRHAPPNRWRRTSIPSRPDARRGRFSARWPLRDIM